MTRAANGPAVGQGRPGRTGRNRTGVQSATRRRRMQAIGRHLVDALLLVGIVAVLLLALALVPVAR